MSVVLRYLLIASFAGMAFVAFGQPKTSIEVNVVGYTELPYELRMGEHYDLRPPTGGPIVVLPSRRERVPLHVVAPPPAASQVPSKILDTSWNVTSSSSAIPADTELAVGPEHLVAVTSTGVFAYRKSDSAAVLSMGLGGFFSSLSPSSATFPTAFYDDFRDRFVVLAADVDNTAPDSDLLIAVSATGDPSGSWYQLKIPTLLPTFDPDGPGPAPPSPHLADRPRVGLEGTQIYVAFSMRSGGSSFAGTAVWNIWKDPLYAGGNTTIQAGIRPFSSGNDYLNEVPLKPVRIRGSIVDEAVDRGIFLLGYEGRQIAGTPSLQVFWLTTVSPSVSKFVVPLANVDDLSFASLPTAPQRDSGIGVPTGDRSVTSAIWQDGRLWLATTVVPIVGPDAGEATAHWIELAAPNPGSVSLARQGNVSGDALVAEAHTFFPSLDVSASGVVAIGYSLSAPSLELSSLLSFVGPQCELAQVALAPEFLRRGESVWPVAEWGAYSDTVLDGGLCFWHHHAHPAASAMPTWQSAVGRFCFDPSLIFSDGFESGSLDQWCASN